jgi:CheY-like chemotaxis protein
MNQNTNWISILIADDSMDDCKLLQRAFQEAGVINHLDFVRDGQELLDFLRQKPAAGEAPKLPGLILLDLNMPRLDGREALKAIRSDPDLSVIPIVILSTSSAREDVLGSYRLGANSVMVKPMTYAEFVDLVAMVKRYWLDHVQLPVRFST